MNEQDEPPSSELLASGGGSTGTWTVLLGARFDVGLTARLLPVAVQTLMLLVAIGGCGLIVAAMTTTWWLGLCALLVVPVVVVLIFALVRVGAEMVLAVLDMSARVTEMADRLPGLESTVGGMASDMPKLGFLRLRSGGR
ncbi:DUF4282 domain-containing protein [Pseudonocardia spinosispora]|uniref:DUF4282 domain-containing protein n=1 Tax=Pseudonocardia spinosispora TaxID=103441 RepID=UPI0004270F9F|nr:DUF4282 domain-containing protein [Pseudonocardia spinosispora]